MMKTIAVYHKMKKGILDDFYTLYENGLVLHEYDKSIYPGGQDFREIVSVGSLSEEIKKKLLEAASDENKLVAQGILGL